jgi:hypothetical protein
MDRFQKFFQGKLLQVISQQFGDGFVLMFHLHTGWAEDKIAIITNLKKVEHLLIYFNLYVQFLGNLVLPYLFPYISSFFEYNFIHLMGVFEPITTKFIDSKNKSIKKYPMEGIF